MCIYIYHNRSRVLKLLFVTKAGTMKIWKTVSFWGIHVYVLGKFLSCMIYLVMSVVIEDRIETLAAYAVK